MFLGFSPSSEAVRVRRKIAPIHGYCGPNSSGKTLGMLTDGRPAVLAGLPILSTVRIHDIVDSRPCDDPRCDCDKSDEGRHRAAYSGWVPWRNWQDFLDFDRGEVWADEVTGVMASGDFSTLPGEVSDRLMQLRRAEIVFRWTAPAFARADKKLREVTQAVTVCTGFMGKRSPEHAWVQNRAFLWLTFDARLLDDFDNKASRLRASVRQVAFKPDAFDLYDTFAPVYRLDHVR